MPELTATRLALLRKRLARSGELLTGAGVAPEPGAVGAEFGGAAELGTAERRMWKIYDLDRDSVSHNIGLVLDFGGERTIDSVVAAAELLVARYDILNALIDVDPDGVPHRKAAHRAGRWVVAGRVWQWGIDAALDLELDDLGGEPDVDAVARILTGAAFDLTTAAPLRIRVTRSEGWVAMVLVVHHLAVDDTSWPLLLGALVSGSWPEPDSVGDAGADLPSLPTAGRVDAATRHALATWAAEGVRYPLSGDLPTLSAADSWLAPMDDRPGRKLTYPVDPSAVGSLSQVAHGVGATGNAVLIAACALSVHALTGAADFVLLIPTDNRHAGQRPERVGYCGNIVPMRFRVDPDQAVGDALRDAIAVVYDAMEFADVDYGPILTALRGQGGRFPVAEIMASVRSAPLRGIEQPEGTAVTCRSVFTGIANYPLTLAFEIQHTGQVHLEVDYQPDVLGDDEAKRAAALVLAMVDRLPQALEVAVAELVHACRGCAEQVSPAGVSRSEIVPGSACAG